MSRGKHHQNYTNYALNNDDLFQLTSADRTKIVGTSMDINWDHVVEQARIIKKNTVNALYEASKDIPGGKNDYDYLFPQGKEYGARWVYPKAASGRGMYIFKAVKQPLMSFLELFSYARNGDRDIIKDKQDELKDPLLLATDILHNSEYFACLSDWTGGLPYWTDSSFISHLFFYTFYKDKLKYVTMPVYHGPISGFCLHDRLQSNGITYFRQVSMVTHNIAKSANRILPHDLQLFNITIT